MPRRISVNGTIQTFPDDATDAEISTALNLPKSTPAPDRTWTDTAVDALPSIGGAIGGITGAIGGTVAGFGVGGVPGAIGGAALGGAAGEAARQLAERARGKAAPGTMTDAALGIGTEAGTQAVMETVGAGIGSAAKVLGPRLMQSALKPGVKTILSDVRRGVPVPKVVQTLLDEGINVTEGGLSKLQGLLSQKNTEIAAAIAPLTGTIERKTIAARALAPAAQLAKTTNPTADLKALGAAVDEFLNPSVMGGALSPQEAQAMKVATYRQIGNKYGTPAALRPAEIDAQMAFARGLKEEIEALATAQGRGDVRALNASEGKLLEVLDPLARRVAQAGNTNPIGFAFVAHAPTMFLAALIDKNPAVKSMLARGLYQSAGKASQISPQLIRLAVQATAASEE